MYTVFILGLAKQAEIELGSGRSGRSVQCSILQNIHSSYQGVPPPLS